MILIDTSVWIDHLRSADAVLQGLLDRRRALAHPFVIGELALGSLRRGAVLLSTMRDMPQAVVADPEEVLALINRHKLAGAGIGYVDAHLLAATLLTPEARLWSRDRRLATLAHGMGIAAET